MLRVERLLHRAGRFCLRIEHLHLERGAYHVLLGPSGAGKTMFLETVAGLHRAGAGRIWIGGREVTRTPPERRNIGFVYQHYWLFPHLSVYEILRFGLRYRRRRDRVGEDGLRELADNLGFMKATPRDIVDIHCTAIVNKTNVVSKRMKRYQSEGKMLLIELMGYLVSHYRKYSLLLDEKRIDGR